MWNIKTMWPFKSKYKPNCLKLDQPSFEGPLVKQADLASEQFTPISHKLTMVKESWDKGYRGRTAQGVPIPIFILDTGGSFDHPDLKDGYAAYPRARQARHKKGTSPKNLVTGGLDATQDDWQKPCGYGERWKKENAKDVHTHGHGTGTASVAGARDNKLGIVGVAPEADIWSIRVFVDLGGGNLYTCDKWLAKAIRHCVPFCKTFYPSIDGGVISMSIGTRGIMDPCVQDALRYARENGFIIVASSGNDGEGVNLPAAYLECIAVGAMSRSKKKMKWTSSKPNPTTGRGMDLVDVGEKVLVAHPNGGYVWSDGTSFSCPATAGYAALWKCKYNGEIPTDTFAFRKAILGASIPVEDNILDQEPGWYFVDSPKLARWLDINDPRHPDKYGCVKKAILPIRGRDVEVVIG